MFLKLLPWTGSVTAWKNQKKNRTPWSAFSSVSPDTILSLVITCHHWSTSKNDILTDSRRERSIYRYKTMGIDTVALHSPCYLSVWWHYIRIIKICLPSLTQCLDHMYLSSVWLYCAVSIWSRHTQQLVLLIELWMVYSTWGHIKQSNRDEICTYKVNCITNPGTWCSSFRDARIQLKKGKEIFYVFIT